MRLYRTRCGKDGEFNKCLKEDKTVCFLMTTRPYICPGHWSDIHGAAALSPPAHNVAVRRQRKLLGCAAFRTGGTTGFPSTAIALPTTRQDSKWAINVFSMALYQAHTINYSPVSIISQVIAPLYCPANCTKGGREEGRRRG